MTYYRRYRRSSKNASGIWLAGVLMIICAALLLPAGTLLESNHVLPILVVLGVVIGLLGGWLLYFFGKQELKRLRALRLADIDTMGGVVFEHYIGELLKFQGFHVTYTPASGDLGGDIIASLNGDRYCIQMKRYTNNVDRTAISDAVAAMTYYGCNKSMVVTNRDYTPGAKTLAATNRCELINRKTLIDWIVAFQDGTKNPRLQKETPSELKNVQDWKSGTEPMTEAQRNYLSDLAKKAGEPFDDTLTKSQASARINELKVKLGRP